LGQQAGHDHAEDADFRVNARRGRGLADVVLELTDQCPVMAAPQLELNVRRGATLGIDAGFVGRASVLALDRIALASRICPSGSARRVDLARRICPRMTARVSASRAWASRWPT